MKEFSERFEDLLKEKELSQLAFSRMIGVSQSTVSQSTVSRWVNGEDEPGISYFKLICETLDVRPEYLLGMED